MEKPFHFFTRRSRHLVRERLVVLFRLFFFVVHGFFGFCWFLTACQTAVPAPQKGQQRRRRLDAACVGGGVQKFRRPGLLAAAAAGQRTSVGVRAANAVGKNRPPRSAPLVPRWLGPKNGLPSFTELPFLLLQLPPSRSPRRAWPRPNSGSARS